MTPTTDDITNTIQLTVLGITIVAGIAGATSMAITGVAIHLAIEFHREHYGI